MDEIITTFHVDWKMLVAQIINFGLVFLILYVFALRPLVKKMNERTSKIERGLSDAEKNAKLLQETEKQSNDIIKGARSESSDIINQAKSTADKERERLMEQAQQEALAIVESGKRDLVAEQDKILSGTRDQLAHLVEQSTRKVLGETITPEIDQRLILESIKEFEKDLSTTRN